MKQVRMANWFLMIITILALTAVDKGRALGRIPAYRTACLIMSAENEDERIPIITIGMLDNSFIYIITGNFFVFELPLTSMYENDNILEVNYRPYEMRYKWPELMTDTRFYMIRRKIYDSFTITDSISDYILFTVQRSAYPGLAAVTYDVRNNRVLEGIPYDGTEQQIMVPSIVNPRVMYSFLNHETGMQIATYQFNGNGVADSNSLTMIEQWRQVCYGDEREVSLVVQAGPCARPFVWIVTKGFIANERFHLLGYSTVISFNVTVYTMPSSLAYMEESDYDIFFDCRYFDANNSMCQIPSTTTSATEASIPRVHHDHYNNFSSASNHSSFHRHFSKNNVSGGGHPYFEIRELLFENGTAYNATVLVNEQQQGPNNSTRHLTRPTNDTNLDLDDEDQDEDDDEAEEAEDYESDYDSDYDYDNDTETEHLQTRYDRLRKRYRRQGVLVISLVVALIILLLLFLGMVAMYFQKTSPINNYFGGSNEEDSRTPSGGASGNKLDEAGGSNADNNNFNDSGVIDDPALTTPLKLKGRSPNNKSTKISAKNVSSKASAKGSTASTKKKAIQPKGSTVSSSRKMSAGTGSAATTSSTSAKRSAINGTSVKLSAINATSIKRSAIASTSGKKSQIASASGKKSQIASASGKKSTIASTSGKAKATSPSAKKSATNK